MIARQRAMILCAAPIARQAQTKHNRLRKNDREMRQNRRVEIQLHAFLFKRRLCQPPIAMGRRLTQAPLQMCATSGKLIHRITQRDTE